MWYNVILNLKVYLTESRLWTQKFGGTTYLVLPNRPELRYRDVTDRQRRIAGTSYWAASVWLSHGPSGGARPGNVGMPKVPRFSQFQPSRCVGRPPGHEYAEELRQ
jgi:hypothetical protein